MGLGINKIADAIPTGAYRAVPSTSYGKLGKSRGCELMDVGGKSCRQHERQPIEVFKGSDDEGIRTGIVPFAVAVLAVEIIRLAPPQSILCELRCGFDDDDFCVNRLTIRIWHQCRCAAAFRTRPREFNRERRKHAASSFGGHFDCLDLGTGSADQRAERQYSDPCQAALAILLPLRQFWVRLQPCGVELVDDEAHHRADRER